MRQSPDPEETRVNVLVQLSIIAATGLFDGLVHRVISLSPDPRGVLAKRLGSSLASVKRNTPTLITYLIADFSE